MAETIRVLGFAGSLRKGSFNRALLGAAGELLPENMHLDTFDLEGIPLFNQDLELQPSGRLQEFKARIRRADGVLIVTPEYNYSIPGVLKNAIDAASRPYGDNAFKGKPAAIMGTSVGMLGTSRAQYHLRQCCVFLDMYPLNAPEVMVPFAEKAFDAGGRLVDGKARDLVAAQLRAFADWILRLKAGSPALAASR